jgi:hypothetical protein
VQQEDESRAAEQRAEYEFKALNMQEQKHAERRSKTRHQVDTLKEKVCAVSD